MDADIRLKVIDLKEKIHDLTEYLQSDNCMKCGEVALRIEEYTQKLSELIFLHDTNN